MNLCVSCRNFSLHSFSSDPDGIRAYSLASVQNGVDRGCEFCRLLVTVLSDDIACAPYAASRTWIRMRVSREIEPKERSAGLAYNKLFVKLTDNIFPKIRQQNSEGGKEHELCLAADKSSSAAKNGDVSGRYLGEDPSSNLHTATIHQWLQKCDTHKPCNQTNSGTVHLSSQHAPLPTRCIDVQSKELVLRETHGLQGTYVTLSHRWNEATEKCKTTTANISARMSKIELNDLSKTFQDAIVITRRLGFRFIWIDSLCIVQSGDGGTDWSNEALKMGQYYQNSMFTIAATGYATQDGFLSLRRQRPFKSLVRLPYRDKHNTHAGYMYIYSRLESINDQFLKGVWNSELLNRGWVYQEWLLSRRVVYFTPTQIFLECAAGHLISESGDTIRHPDAPGAPDQMFNMKIDLDLNRSSIEDTWYRILEVYSRLNFTMADKDRIVALAGIASEVREVYVSNDRTKNTQLPLEYVSGLWLRDVHHGLLWEQKKAPSEYQRVASLPTWSWASILLEVKWPKRRKRTQPAFKVINLISSSGERYDLMSSCMLPSQRTGESSSMPLLGLNSEDIDDSADDPTTNNLSSSRTYDVDNTFTVLHIRANLIQLLRCGLFSSKADIRTAAWNTGVDLRHRDLLPWIGGLQAGSVDPVEWEAALGLDSRSKPWQMICSTRIPDIIVGWGSFERPFSPTESGPVKAIHVSTELDIPGGLAVGTLGVSHEVANVLFVECVGGSRYRRIGMGKIFDRDVIGEFRKTYLRDIELE